MNFTTQPTRRNTVKKKLQAVLIALIMALTTLALTNTAPAATAAPVEARKAYGTDVTHASDDSGYTADIHIVCTNGTHLYLGLGDSSVFDSPACSGGGVQRIVVGYNQTVYCKNYLPPYQNRYFYTGEYNEVPSYASLKCYMQRPL